MSRSLASALLFSLAAACGAANKGGPQSAGASSPAPPETATSTSTSTSPTTTNERARDIAAPVAPSGGGSSESTSVQTRGRDKTAAPPPPDTSAAPPIDPKEAARSSGLTGPTDQGAFADGFDDSVTVAKITGIDAEAQNDVRTAITHHVGAVEACYRDALTRKPKLAGTFTVSLYVGTDGALASAAMVGGKLGGKLGDKALQDCLLRTVNATKLEHGLGKKRVKITVALAFKTS